MGGGSKEDEGRKGGKEDERGKEKVMELGVLYLLPKVYMIGLVRRPDRRNRMIACLEELNFNYTLFDAVDGR